MWMRGICIGIMGSQQSVKEQVKKDLEELLRKCSIEGSEGPLPEFNMSELVAKAERISKKIFFRKFYLEIVKRGTFRYEGLQSSDGDSEWYEDFNPGLVVVKRKYLF